MQKRKKNRLFILGLIIFLGGISIVVIPFIYDKHNEKVENIMIDDFFSKTYIDTEADYIPESTSVKESVGSTIEDEYIMLLEIPNIDLKRGLYPIGHKKNSIKYNIAIMDESKMPDEDKSNLVLAAHRGTSKVAFFDRLVNLNIHDKAYIYYRGIKYIYELDKNYDVLKNGSVEIDRDVERQTLTLVTCKKNTKDRQTVWILYLVDKIPY